MFRKVCIYPLKKDVNGLVLKMRVAISLIPIFLIFLISCTNNEEVITNYPFLQKKDENITLLFSDDHFISAEGNYYDALLDVKRRYPEKIRSFNIIHSSDRDLIRHYNIQEYPTLLVIHNEYITIRVEGPLKKIEILELLEKALVQKID
ncbi:hypothetical protein H1D32_16120 [Anaerobacillus sp. CMMVII]|uniref:hypothetical protein n=1 Tax=Anaerobacillus sp. CMMVII TaxID=2755588 RepID=UPI0021B8484C|nr:hypothetical protein [Anaerobacillus sp. CMMVII]MCT8139092.1 hypothetical protein [Anaerobacillus sp. CMMVII]